MEVRQVRAEEVLGLVKEAVDTNAFLSSVGKKPFTVEKFLEYAGDPQNIVFGIFSGIEARGFITLFIQTEQVDIGPMYIGEKFRGEGLGKLQLEYIVKWTKEKKYKRIYTKTWGQNSASIATFTSLGFKVINEMSNARINGDSTIEMILEL